jgi:tetratricopeptide (TPR) repeat protein
MRSQSVTPTKTVLKNRHLEWLVLLLLVATTAAVYWQVRAHEFVNYDDGPYVYENPHVRAGLTAASVKWAFTAAHLYNWHPLTWLSHMLDCQLYGLDAGKHHMTSLLFHAANTVLLFLVLRRMTGAMWRSAFVAALFALHPLHVESVAWVAERKDVLSTLFWLLTMMAYVRYAEKPCPARYVPVLVLFALGLTAKPMLVTVPIVLLLLDYWPLGRVEHELSVAGTKVGAYWRLIREKLPLFALAATSCVITYLVQRSGGAVKTLEQFSLRVRVGNAFVACMKYIGKMFWPRALAAFYPHPGSALRLWQVVAAVLLFVCISALVYRLTRRHRYLGTGWAWYVVTLGPVIGIVQVGTHEMADRYTYVPLIGLFVMVAWGVPEIVARWRHRQVGLAVSAVAVLSALTACTSHQVGHWRDSVTLFEHALRVTSNNALAHTNLGHALLERGRADQAIDHLTKALAIRPGYVKARTNLGIALAGQGRFEDAVAHFTEALARDPDNVDAHYNMGVAMVKRGDLKAAASHFSEVLRIKPDDADAHFSLGAILMTEGKLTEAAAEFEAVLRLSPEHGTARNYLDQVRQGERKGD